MDIFKIVAIGIISAVIVLLLKDKNPEMAMLIGVGCGIIVILSVLDELFEVVYTFYEIADRTGIEGSLLENIVKIIGIGYLTEFGSNICLDAGCKGVADKMLLAGKICIMIVAMPIIINLVEIIIGMLP